NLVARVEAAEQAQAPGCQDLALAVARNYAKLLAYKDEYEVARLYRLPGFRESLDQQFDGNFRIRFHLAPPVLGETDPATGQPRKRAFGGWMMSVFALLARFKGLRGTALDPFGRTSERQLERQLIADYEALIATLIDGLTADNHRIAVRLADLPQQIRGFGHVKLAAIELARKQQGELLAGFQKQPTTSRAAE
ncbi:MAG TPA: DUF6537 domain-containing protein, partial [Dongiaceae bacterium]